MTGEELAAIKERVARWKRGYWLAGVKSALLIQKDGDARHEIAHISAEHAATIDLLTHAYADLQLLLESVEHADYALSEFADRLSIENAQLRAQIAGTVDEDEADVHDYR